MVNLGGGEEGRGERTHSPTKSPTLGLQGTEGQVMGPCALRRSGSRGWPSKHQTLSSYALFCVTRALCSCHGGAKVRKEGPHLTTWGRRSDLEPKVK